MLDWSLIGSVIVLFAVLAYDYFIAEDDKHGAPTGLYVILVILVGGFAVAEPYWPLANGTQGTFFQMVGLAAVQNPVNPNIPVNPSPTTGAPLQVMGTIQDFYTHASLGATNAKVDILTPGVYTAALEQITVSTSTKLFTSTLQYPPGTNLLLHISSTEGNGYYDAWYPVLVPSSVYTYSNTQYYWLAPTGALPGSAFFLKNRVASLSFTLTNSTGSQLNSATGSTQGSTTAYTTSGGVTLASGSGYFVAQTTTPTLTIYIYSNTLSTEYGTAMSVITPNMAFVTRQLVLWMAVNSTAVNAGTITSAGWTLVPSYAVGYLTFYTPIPPIVSTVTAYGSWSITTTIDTSSCVSGKNTTVGFWIDDLQSTIDASSGIYDAAPTAKGASAQVSPSALLPATGYIRLSSGAPTQPWISCKLKNK
jgi:hypothetical protein